MEDTEVKKSVESTPFEISKYQLLIAGLIIMFILGLISRPKNESVSLVTTRLISIIYGFIGYYWIILDSYNYEISLSFRTRRLIIWFEFIMFFWYIFKTRKLAGFATLGKLTIYSLLLIFTHELGAFVVRLINST